MSNFYDDVPENAHKYNTQNNPFIVEDEDGVFWDEQTGLPVISNRDRYYRAGTAALQGKR